jgi:hypothetical protein
MLHPARPLRPPRLFLTLIILGCAAFSGAALLLHAAGWLPMYFLVNLLAAPSLVLLLGAGIVADRINEPVLLNRLITGAWAGLVATVAYDLIRAGLWGSGIIDFNPFLSHPGFGRLITGLPEHTPTAIAVGWAYHFWNGVGFGIMYTVVVGRARWWYGLVWALILELAWITALPSVLALKLNIAYLAVSVIGHGAYGVVLGLLAQRFVRAE